MALKESVMKFNKAIISTAGLSAMVAVVASGHMRSLAASSELCPAEPR
jgi:hypothetical protein